MGDSGTCLLYLRAHHLPLIVATVVLLVVDAAVTAAFSMRLPTLEGTGSIGIPLPLLAPMVAVGVLVGVLHGPALAWEESSPANARAAQSRYLGLLAVCLPVLVALTTFATSSPGLALVMARATLIWLSLAVTSSRLFGWRQAWIIPLASFLPLSYLSVDAAGHYRWWYWPGQPPAAPACTLLAVALCCTALLGYHATPRRIRRVAAYWAALARSVHRPVP